MMETAPVLIFCINNIENERKIIFNLSTKQVRHAVNRVKNGINPIFSMKFDCFLEVVNEVVSIDSCKTF